MLKIPRSLDNPIFRLKDGKVYARGDPETLLTEDNIRTIFGG